MKQLLLSVMGALLFWAAMFSFILLGQLIAGG
jgi:hypothetical protein